MLLSVHKVSAWPYTLSFSAPNSRQLFTISFIYYIAWWWPTVNAETCSRFFKFTVKVILCLVGENTKYLLKCKNIRGWYSPRLLQSKVYRSTFEPEVSVDLQTLPNSYMCLQYFNILSSADEEIKTVDCIWTTCASFVLWFTVPSARMQNAQNYNFNLFRKGKNTDWGCLWTCRSVL